MAHATRRTWRAAAFVALLGWCAGVPATAAPAGARTVLTIHSGSEFFAPNPLIDGAIRGVLLGPGAPPVDYYTEYLESDRFGGDAGVALSDYVAHKYRSRHVDLVIAVTNDALAFVLAHRALFPDAPIVFGGVAVPSESDRLSGAGIAVMRVGSAYVQTVKLALQLHPATKNLYVLARSPNQQDVNSVRAQLGPFAPGVRLTFIEEDTLDRALDVIRGVPPQSLVLHIWQRGERSQPDVDPVEAARRVAAASPVPVYGTVDLNVGSGIVGGVVRGTTATGTRLGQIAVQVLTGTPAQRIPAEDAPLVPIFDWRQVKRWGIDRARLPPDTELRFWTPTAWEAYRPYIIGTIVVVTAQLLAIAGLLVQRAQRRRAESLVRRSYERIRRLTGQLITAQEEARADIARDLHDGVCQELAGVSIAVGSLKSSSGQIQDGPAQLALGRIQKETLGMFEGIRRLSHELHPATLRLIGPASALEAHCAEAEKRFGVNVPFSAAGAFTDLDPDVAVGVFRIAQEALRNAIAHGKAGQVSVSLVRSGNDVELTVADNGIGFDLETARRAGSGLGIVSIEERAHVLGGSADIVTRPGRGTTVRVRCPAASAAEGW